GRGRLRGAGELTHPSARHRGAGRRHRSHRVGVPAVAHRLIHQSSRTCMWLVVAVALAAGCGSSSAPGWTEPGMTKEQLGRDTLQCLTEARSTTPGRDGPRTQVDQTRYRRCMAERGYTAVQ